MSFRGLLRPRTRLCRSGGMLASGSFSNGRTFVSQQVTLQQHGSDQSDVDRQSSGSDQAPWRPLSHVASTSAEHTPLEQSRSRVGQNSTGNGADTRERVLSDSQPDVLKATPRYDGEGFHVEDSDSTPVTRFTLSTTSQAKLGLTNFSITTSNKIQESAWTFDRKINSLRKLDQACQKFTLSGLGCLIYAVRDMATVLPRARRRVVSLHAITTEASTRVTVRMDASRYCSIEVGQWRIIATDKHQGSRSLRVAVRLHVDRSTSDHASAKSYTMEDDLWYLHKTATMVIERVTRAIEFDSVDDMLISTAQSLLRILQPRTSFLTIWSAIVRDMESGRRGVASWATIGDLAAPDVDRLTRKVISTVSGLGSYGSVVNSEGQDERRLGRHQFVANSQIRPTSSSSPKANDVPDVPMLARHGSDVALEFSSRSDALFTRFGVDSLSLKLTGHEHSSAGLTNLTKAEISRSMEHAIVHATDTGLLGFKEIAERLQKSLLGSPYARLELQGFVDLGHHGDILHAGYRTLVATYKNYGPNQGVTSLRFPVLRMVTGRLRSTEEHKPVHLGVELILLARSIAAAADGAAASQQCSQLLQAIHGLLSPILNRSSSTSQDQLAYECATAVIDAPRPLQGIFHIYRVIARVAVIPSADAAVKWQDMVISSSSLIQKPIIALGSNVGNRVGHIEDACAAIDADPDMAVCATSALYETRPMYVEDQGSFVNGVCQVKTSLNPTELLNRLQSIENTLGRVKLVDKGPRNIDLDIVMHDERVLKTERLTVPHPLMLEREFVLRPYCDIHENHRHPLTRNAIGHHLEQLVSGELSMFPLTPLAPGCEALRSLDPLRQTRVMSILNVTPDSFSDGGENQPTHTERLRDTIASQIAAGATIIDIGGQSSRPHAPDVPTEEEIARILPVIEIIKNMPEAKHITISIDTYRAAVAEAAVSAGAHIINDISAGLLDPDMLPTVARLGCTYIMMHMRGTPATMQQPENTTYKNGLVNTIIQELCERLRAAKAAGIRRWRIILDPGIGFAKTAEQNAELLGRFGEMRNDPRLKTYPWLVGSSRKGFVGKFTDAEDPKDRVEGTAATVTAAVAGGAEMVRVHDVKEMVRVVKMADAMYRRSKPQLATEEGRNGQ